MAAVYALAATGRVILDADEGVYAHIPQQMLERGDWLTPYVNGVRSLDKPPLLYWLTAISYSLFGVNAFAAHVPGILGVVGTAWFLQRLAALAAGPVAGRYAALAFAFSVGTFLFTLEVMHDILLVLFLSAAMLCLALTYRHPTVAAVLGFFAATTGAFLSKGLIGVAFPVGIALVYMAVTRELPPVRLRWLLWGGLLFAALAAPWHIAMEIRNPGFLEIHFFEEQILRFFNQREPMDIQSVPLPLFWLLIPVWLFPWSCFLPAAFRLPRSRPLLMVAC
ncbi:MAG: hypothetical protein GY953_02075, partial [bacterium]|nr:hypothetical protein [bacterium]